MEVNIMKITFFIIIIIASLLIFRILFHLGNMASIKHQILLSKSQLFESEHKAKQIQSIADITDKFLDKIDLVIATEIESKHTTLISENKMFNLTTIPELQKSITKDVINGLRFDILDEHLLFITEDYMYKYVQRRVFNVLMSYADTYNSEYRNKPQTDVNPVKFLKRFG